MSLLHVDARRLHRHLDRLARIGALPGGGVCRLAFSDEDRAGRAYVEERMRALGLEVRVDGIGNVMGLRAGREPGPPVLAGSHVDTVGTGGRFDGSLGVLAALEAVEVLNEAGVSTRRPLGVVAFANEEGVRFMPDMMGSLVFRGDLRVDEARRIVGIDGATIGTELDRTGYAGPDDFTGMAVHAYVELHVEQGPVLEAEGVPVGVVEGVQGLSWFAFQLRGQSNHAGTTPMHLRRDAGYVAAGIVRYARQLAREVEGQRATAGMLRLGPGLVNVVAGEAAVTVDLRNPDAGRLREAEARLLEAAAGLAREEGVELTHRSLARVDPVRFDEQVVGAVAAAAERLGHASRRLLSGAGHDAQILSTRYPAAMIFVPSRGGISHNVDEYTSPEHVAAGADVLLHTLLALAG